MPLSDDEVARIINQVEEGADKPRALVSYEVGEQVNVTDGPFEGFSGLVEEVDENGIVNIFSSNQEDMDNAVERVKAIIAVPEVGETYVGKVKSIKDFGAFIEFMPGKDGLLHISEIKWERVENMEGVLEEGEEVKVKLIEIDRRTGKFRLSRKALLPKPEKKDK